MNMSLLLKILSEDLSNHRGEWSRPGFQAIAIYRLGLYRRSLRQRWLRGLLLCITKPLSVIVRNVYGIELPESASIGRGVVIEHQGGIVVHGNAVIGEGCIIRQGVTIGNRYQDKPFDAPKMGIGVSIGAGAKILGAITIGDSARIGANAVVLRDVPSGSTAIGIPARVVRTRKSEAL